MRSFLPYAAIILALIAAGIGFVFGLILSR